MQIFQYRYIFIILFIVANSATINAQNPDVSVCGNKFINKIALLDDARKKNLKNLEKSCLNNTLAKNNSLKQDIFRVPVKAHIIRDSNGLGGIGAFSIQKSLNELNIIFSEIFITFYLVEDLEFIDDSSLDNFRKGDEALILDKYVPGALNIYFTNKIVNILDNSICGYNISNADQNIIVIKNSCAVNGSSLAHEIGHFFSLVHTHGVNGTQELVDGSNCDTTGDGICDTPADPRLSHDNTDEACNYIGSATDANGVVYNPDTFNVMSYSRKACRANFSNQQYARMLAYFLTVKDEIFQLPEISSTTTEGLENATIYPNPVSNGLIFINREPFLNNQLQFQITNLAGQILLKGITNTDTVNITNLASGSYLLTLSNAETTITKRFVK